MTRALADSDDALGATRAQRRTVQDRLAAIDWDFPDALNGESIHSIHPYPARFIAEIPRALIREMPPPSGSGVLDPFCGCGTTLVEAQSAGFRSTGVDLNPIATLVARVKTVPLPHGFLNTAMALVRSARALADPVVPHIPHLDHWYQQDVQLAIAAIATQIAALQEADLADHMRVALSSILVRVSNQDSDTRYAAVRKRTSGPLVFSLFLAACKRLAKIKGVLPLRRPPAHVILSDVLTLTPRQISMPVGLVITSPPYPNAYEYWLYHKYRMWWLGYDPLHVKDREIGARAHYFRKNHPTTEDFARQIGYLFRLLFDVAVPGAYVCVVVGRSRIHGREIDNTVIVNSAAGSAGFANVADLPRIIAPGRKSFNLSHARIRNEHVLVYRRAPD